MISSLEIVSPVSGSIFSLYSRPKNSRKASRTSCILVLISSSLTFTFSSSRKILGSIRSSVRPDPPTPPEAFLLVSFARMFSSSNGANISCNLSVVSSAASPTLPIPLAMSSVELLTSRSLSPVKIPRKSARASRISLTAIIIPFSTGMMSLNACTIYRPIVRPS